VCYYVGDLSEFRQFISSMSEQNSLMNIGDLAKPATTLIEKIADATGAYFLPWQIKRVAKAEAEAKKITALTKREIAEANEIQQRTLAWAIGEQTKFQENRERILLGAIPELKEDAKPEEIDNDWLSNFFDKCKLVSNEEMQSLWSKILAGESNKAGSFSKRTVEMVSSFDKSDAEMFTKLCSFGVNFPFFLPLIYLKSQLMGSTPPKSDIYKKNGINISALFHLESIGLVTLNHLLGFPFGTKTNKLKATYYKTQINLELNPSWPNELKVGNVRLTRSGHELAKICNSNEVNGFLDFLFIEWEKLGYKFSILSPDKSPK
jgi:hypothetical protein